MRTYFFKPSLKPSRFFLTLGLSTALLASTTLTVYAAESPTTTQQKQAEPTPSTTSSSPSVAKNTSEATPVAATTPPAPTSLETAPPLEGMPSVINPQNIYSEANPANISATAKEALSRIYVPNLRSNTVSVIDPASMKVVDTFKVGKSPQHVVPAWDLQTLWVTNNSEGSPDGSLTPINPKTGKPGPALSVDDPYNMYFTPNGQYAIVVAEAHKRLDFRDPHTMALKHSLSVPNCKGINHAAYSQNGRYALFTCEFGGHIAKIDVTTPKVMGDLKLSKGGMPQDVLAAPNGKIFYVADMLADGVFIIDGDSFKEIGFIPTGVGTHGLYPSRDATKMYVANRGSHKIHGPRHSKEGSISVIDFATNKVVQTWPIPGGGSPDMGNVSADGKTLWLSGRFDDVVYAINTETGEMKKIAVGEEPHGLTVWPQPGRFSIGHTGIMR